MPVPEGSIFHNCFWYNRDGTPVYWWGNGITLSGADPTGVTDSTAAFNRASQALGTGAGVVFVPPGTYRIGGVILRDGLYFQGAGRDSTFIVSNGLDDAFKTVGAANLMSGGVSGFSATGNATGNQTWDASVDFINISSAALAAQFIVADNYAIRWRAAYRGSLDDREPRLHNNSFWFNNYGIFIVNNHPLFSGANDIRLNNWGMTGNTMYDLDVTGQKFNYNNYGVMPQPGGIMNNSVFTACTFGLNALVGIQLGQACSVIGGKLIATSTGTCERGIVMIGAGAKVTNMEILSFGAAFSVGAICIDNRTLADGVGMDISNNAFTPTLVGTSGIGTAILQESTASQLTSSVITSNTMRYWNAGDRFIRLLANVFNCNISGNNLYSDGVASANAMIEANGTTVIGNIVQGNSAVFLAGATARTIDMKVPRSIVNNNMARRGTGFNLTGADGDTISTPNIFVA